MPVRMRRPPRLARSQREAGRPPAGPSAHRRLPRERLKLPQRSEAPGRRAAKSPRRALTRAPTKDNRTALARAPATPSGDRNKRPWSAEGATGNANNDSDRKRPRERSTVPSVARPPPVSLRSAPAPQGGEKQCVSSPRFRMRHHPSPLRGGGTAEGGGWGSRERQQGERTSRTQRPSTRTKRAPHPPTIARDRRPSSTAPAHTSSRGSGRR